MSLKDYSDEELNKEMSLRREAAKQKRNDLLDKKHRLVEDNVDLLLSLVPNHDRTSCSDESPINYGGDSCPRCKRCSLLNVKSTGYNDYCVVVDLSLEHVTPER